MKGLRLFAVLLILIFFAGCDYEQAFEQMVPKEESAFAEEFLQKLIEKDTAFIKSHVSDELSQQISEDTLQEVYRYIPEGNLLSSQIVGAQTLTIPASDKTRKIFNYDFRGNFTFDYHFEGGWAVADAVVIKAGETTQVIGFHVYQTTASQKELNAFGFSGKSFFQYLVLAATAFVPIFIFVSLFFCIRTPMKNRKWLWILFILVGVSTLSMNWTNGQFQFQPIYFLLFGAGAIKAGPYGPWTLTVAFPLGAVLFWLKRYGFFEKSTSDTTTGTGVTRKTTISCESCGRSMPQDDVRGDVCPFCAAILRY